MSTTPDPTPLGLPYAIGEVVLSVLRTDASLAGALVSENPTAPADVADGPRILIFRDQGDVLIETAGEAPKRTYTFQVGSLVRSRTARLGAHTDYRAAKRAVRAALFALAPAGVRVISKVRELSIEFQPDGESAGGYLVLGTFALDYRDPD